MEKIEDCYIESLDITFKTCKDLTEKFIDKFCHSGSDSWKYELKYRLNEVDNPNKLKKSIMSIVNKKENSYIEARKCWTLLTPYIWEKSIINRPNITK